ncbi:MAG: tRNA (cytidine(34)-2'-O)-methyltransferase, partial [Alkalibacterium sp.]|nr:tRNA (cytidine(34)-2'-O)-methyltransferase [Alkalibacterium sp.]
MTNHIVLFEPQIPANTGNIARTCAGTNTTLHLIEPLGFKTDDKYLKRAGLDYWEAVDIHYHKNLADFMAYVGNRPLFLISKFAEKVYSDIDYSDTTKDYFFLFGKETTGLPEEFMRDHAEKCLRIPMDDTHV